MTTNIVTDRVSHPFADKLTSTTGQWSPLIERIDPTGKASSASAERRPHVLAVIAVATAAGGAIFLAYDLGFRDRDANRFTLLAAAIMVACCLVAALASRHYRLAAALFLTIVATAALVIPLQDGRNTDIHLFFLALGPLTLILFGARRPAIALTISFVGLVLFLAIELLVPDYVQDNLPLLPQLRNPFVDSIQVDEDAVFVIMMIAFAAILFLAVYEGFRAAAAAEAALGREYARSEALLRALLPEPIVARLKDRPGETIADGFDMVAVLFADIVGFTSQASHTDPATLIDFLNRIFGRFDDLTAKHGLEKIKTIGDSYMVVGGMSDPGIFRMEAMADMALEMIETSRQLTAELGQDVGLRIGIHAGPAIAGVIGMRRPFYDVWGDTVNVAARMETMSSRGRIQVSLTVKEFLGSDYSFEPRGEIEVKGKGTMPLFYLNGRTTGRAECD